MSNETHCAIPRYRIPEFFSILLEEDQADESEDKVQAHGHFRTHRGVLKASLGQAAFGFPVAVGSVVRGLASEPVGPTRRARPGAGLAGSTIHSADSRAIGAVGSADCAVSRFACRPDPCCVDVYRACRRGRPMGASASCLEGPRL